PPRGGRAVHERAGAHRQARQPVEDRAAAVGELRAAALERVELADRRAGAERAARTGERDQADVRIGLELVEDRLERRHRGRPDRVPGGRVVERDQCQRAVPLEPHRRAGRRRLPAVAERLLEVGAAEAPVAGDAAVAGGGVQLSQGRHRPEAYAAYPPGMADPISWLGTPAVNDAPARTRALIDRVTEARGFTPNVWRSL